MVRFTQLTAILAAISLCSARKPTIEERQIPADPAGVKTITSPQGATIRFKQPGKAGVCETKEGDNEHVLLVFRGSREPFGEAFDSMVERWAWKRFIDWFVPRTRTLQCHRGSQDTMEPVLVERTLEHAVLESARGCWLFV
jgi:hypothetical protein